MKLLRIAILGILLPIAALAQAPARPTHQLQLGVGTFDYAYPIAAYARLGLLSSRLSYGLDIPVAASWSVMPEVGSKFCLMALFAPGAVGADFVLFSYWDFTVNARYHLPDGVILGLGPMLSYTFHQDKYYVDADPTDPLNGLPKNTRVNVSLRPSVIFHSGRRWHLGAEAELGLNNAMVQYPQYHRTGCRHLHALRFVVGIHF